MKKKITYIAIMVAIALTAFFVGKNTTMTTENVYKNADPNIEAMEYAFSNVAYWEVTDDGLNLYDYDGNLYEWRR